ncbi:hypothetical protein B0H13DRAFT_2290372 [Mycena leptocephala]|nr:hypothetical protein B0H13DRAFT_2290372 [Mycena leptocephala]
MAIITIFSTNGNQGSAVLDAVLANGNYTPRAVSRSLDSDGSKALIAKGVELPSQRKGTVKRVVQPRLALRQPDLSATDKAVIEDYLKVTGIPYAALQTGCASQPSIAPSAPLAFALCHRRLGSLQKTDTCYIIPVPKYGLNDIQSATWVGYDLGAAALALLTNYTDASKGVLSKSYPVVSLRFMYIELAEAVAAAINKEVKFVPVEVTGVLELDEVGNGLRIFPHHRVSSSSGFAPAPEPDSPSPSYNTLAPLPPSPSPSGGVGSGSGTEPHRLVTVSAPLHEFHAMNANSNANTTNNTSASSSTCPATLPAFSHPDASPSHETIPRSHSSVPRGAPQRKSATALLAGR